MDPEAAADLIREELTARAAARLALWPELVATLQAICDGPARAVRPGTFPVWDNARALLAKAKGLE
jgi:hypothetical protein